MPDAAKLPRPPRTQAALNKSVIYIRLRVTQFAMPRSIMSMLLEKETGTDGRFPDSFTEGRKRSMTEAAEEKTKSLPKD
jgi:hypothetical protein